MTRNLCLASLFVAFIAAPVAFAQDPRQGSRQDLRQNLRLARLDANGNLDALIARHAAANNVPEDTVRRVIKRESGGNPRVVSQGNFGLMQIKLATARSMGYTGNAAGLLDAETNMTYAVKYLAGAYQAADGNAIRAVHYYAAGYYYAAKQKGQRQNSRDSAVSAFAASPAAGSDSVSSSTSLYAGRPDYH